MNLGTLALIVGGAYLLFRNKQTPEQTQLEQTVQAWIDRIKANPEWYNSIIDKAAARGVSVEEMLIIEANWIIEQGWQL